MDSIKDIFKKKSGKTYKENFKDFFRKKTAESSNPKFETKTDDKKKHDYFNDLVTPQIEMDCIFKNYKAKKIEIYSESPFKCSADSDDSNNYGNNIKHILIENFTYNEKDVTIPIATFIPINEN